MDILNILKRLSECDGVSGAEGEISDVCAELLKPFGKTYKDKLGNVICETDGEGDAVLLSAHMDRVGLIVTDITNEGFLNVASCGGIDERTLCAQQVTVHASQNLKGVIISTPPHLQDGQNERKALKPDEALVDIGLSKEKAEQLVTRGDRITVDSQFIQLLSDRVAGSAFDDRAGITAILYAAELLKKRKCAKKIIIAFATREEVGGSGAKVASFNSGAKTLIAVDVSFAVTPDSKREECGELGKGPMIGVSASLDYEASKELKAVAIEKRIPYQLEVMGGLTGTDADGMTVAAGGMRSSLVSIPLRYMHTGVEVVSLSDIENTGRLIAEYIISGGAE
ncbi:MAG: M42 family metallopeptidase [Ruminococcaceae bacterium]|nr:M42 family metallopeptidase [Oscillospiraceae bacterium]